jgi:hypothetical protein
MRAVKVFKQTAKQDEVDGIYKEMNILKTLVNLFLTYNSF